MVDFAGGENTEKMSAEEAFSLLGDETRVNIIQSLWEVDIEPISFSELQTHANIVDSGQFNYHLKKLLGTFVQRDKEGYQLTYAGHQIVGAILGGTYTKHTEISPFETDISCSMCETSLVASYKNDQFLIRCPNCEELILRFAFPPGVLEDRPQDALIKASSSWIRAQLSYTVNGICPNCAGDIQSSIITDDENQDQDIQVEYDCDRCKHHATSTVALHLSYHPAVVAFYNEHNINIQTDFLNSYICNGEQEVKVHSQEPWRISTTVSILEDDLVVVLNENLEVIDRERHKR